MMTTKTLSYLTMVKWCDEETEAACQWATVTARQATAKERESYGIGFTQGFRKAVALLELHGYLKFTYPKTGVQS